MVMASGTTTSRTSFSFGSFEAWPFSRWVRRRNEAIERSRTSSALSAVTTVRRKTEAGGDLNVSLIDLDEGPRLMSRVANLAPDQVRIGQRVRARIVQEQGQGLLVFDAEGGQP
mgnify:CR=1 FL=1